MKIASPLLLPALVLALAGCSHTPEYTQAYYAKHLKARDKAIAYCQTHNHASRAREHNCQAAGDAQLIYGDGTPEKPAKTPSVHYSNPTLPWFGKD